MASEFQLQNRKRLIEALRAEMPTSFEWDFSAVSERYNCHTYGCAIGLAHAIGITDHARLDECASAIGLSEARATRIFIPGETDIRSLAKGYGVTYDEVTPQMVADKLAAA